VRKVEIRDIILAKEKTEIKAFLKTFNLEYESDIEETIAIFAQDTLIATASYAHNIIKCVAIKESCQGQNMTATLVSELLKRLNQKQRHHVFVYTKPEQAHLFEALGFKMIVESLNMTLLEKGDTITRRLEALKDKYHLLDHQKAAVVVNANPMTKGHFHLIETAAKNHDEVLVFVVEEDRSFFPFNVRFEIVKKACEPLKNVTVLPSDAYLVSYATFPKYFLKHEAIITKEHALIDVLTFKAYYMNIFNITDRYVGEEPLSPMTNTYNETMKEHLSTRFHIVNRLKYNNRVISASDVRKMLKEHEPDHLTPYIVKPTLDFLKTKEGAEIIERIRSKTQRH